MIINRFFKCLFVLLAFGILTSGCITNKKIQLLQNNDVNTDNVVTDSVLRHYSLANFEYLIQPEDILFVDVKSLTSEEFNFFSEGQLNNQNIGQGANALVQGYLVDQNGNIQLPVVGDLKVSGLTIFQVQEKIRKQASLFLEQPNVRVRLINYRFTVLGEINSQGTFTLSNNRTSILEAIGLAGGFSELANRDVVKVIRQQDDSAKIFYLNLLDEHFLNTQTYYVHQNDVIIVPPLKQRPLKTDFSRNFSILISSVSLIILIVSLFT